ncbi:MAG: hypothetical protein IME99_00260, partial [Proteobacteria bacterium]|nr:hypothetical protein [Pseudomonadota bacterium]
YKEGGQDIVNKFLSTTYRRGLTRSSVWNLEVNWDHEELTEITDDDIETKISTQLVVKNGVLYQLRSWLLTAEHTYKRKTQFTRDFIETKVMLTASRSFGFMWQ